MAFLVMSINMECGSFVLMMAQVQTDVRVNTPTRWSEHFPPFLISPHSTPPPTTTTQPSSIHTPACEATFEEHANSPCKQADENQIKDDNRLAAACLSIREITCRAQYEFRAFLGDGAGPAHLLGGLRPLPPRVRAPPLHRQQHPSRRN